MDSWWKRIAFVVIVFSFAFIIRRIQNPPRDVVNLALIVPTMENLFYTDMTQAAKAFGYEHIKIFTQAANTQEEQNKYVREYIDKGFQGIAIVPVDTEKVLSVIQEANKTPATKKTSIANVHNLINTGMLEQNNASILFSIASDDEATGELVAEYITQNQITKVLTLQHENPRESKRISTLQESLQETTPEISYTIQNIIIPDDKEKALQTIKELLANDSSISTVFTANGELTIALVQAMKDLEKNPEDITLIGYDYTLEMRTLIGEGYLDATIAQQPQIMGKRTMELLLAFIEEKKVEATYVSPLQVIE